MSRTRMGLLALPIAAAMVFTAPALASAAGGKDKVPSCCQAQRDSTPQVQTDQDEDSYSQDTEFRAAQSRMEQAAVKENLEELVNALEDVIDCLTDLDAPADVIAQMEDHLAQAKNELAALSKEHGEGKGKSPKAKDVAKKASKALDSKKKPKKIAAGGL